MTNEGELETPGSHPGQDPENTNGETSESNQDVAMESESEDEGLIKKTTKRAKRMIIDDDDDDDDDEDNNNTNNNGEEGTGIDDEDDKQESEDGGDRQGPMRLDGDLFDAEESSEDENDLDRVAGPEYDSAEDKDFDESTIDPKLLKKLKKIGGALKKPREQKSRKCKPTKEDMLALHSESQRLYRESHVSLPYHKPAPKTLQDFLARAQKKQEAYKDLKKGTRNDNEKARIIQEKIAETSIIKLPSLRRRERTAPKSGPSQHSDSGVGSSGSNNSQGDSSQAAGESSEMSQSLCPELGESGEDVIDNHSDGLCDSQQTLKGSQEESTGHSHNVRKEDSQQTASWDDILEEFDSPLPKEDSQSQPIEQVESLSVKDDDSQKSDLVIDSVSNSQKADNALDEIVAADNSCPMESVCNESELCDTKPESAENSGKQLQCGENSSVETDSKKHPDSLSPVKTTVEEDDEGDVLQTQEVVASCSADQDTKEMRISALRAARQRAVEELVQKGVVPQFKRGDGDFILLGVEQEPPKKKSDAGIDALLERLVRHQKKKKPEAPADVEISIVEKNESEGQENGLKLSTVKYRTKGDLDLSSIAHTQGNRLEALKAKLEVGMRQKRMEAYERRQQMYKMENEEGYEASAGDGLPEEEEDAELTDKSDTDDEEEEGEEQEEEEEEEELEMDEEEEKKKDWNNPFLDDEADDDDDEVEGDEDDDEDDDYGYDNAPQRSTNAEIDDMKEDDPDLFKDSDQFHLEVSQTERDDEDDEDDDFGTFKKPLNRSQPLIISDDDDSSQLQSAQDPTKTCDPALAANYEKDTLNTSFETLTPMSRLLQDTQPNTYNSHVEDSQDQDCSQSQSDQLSLPLSSTEDTFSQILDADGYFRVATQGKNSTKRSLMLEDSQQAGDGNMDDLMGLCSGKFAEGPQGGFAASGGFGGMFNKRQSQDDQSSVASLFSGSQHSQTALSHSESDSISQSDVARKLFNPSLGDKGEVPASSQSQTSSFNPRSQSQQTFSLPGLNSQSQGGDEMDGVVGLCSGIFPSTNSVLKNESQPKKKKAVKRRLVVMDDSSDEEDNERQESSSFLVLSGDEKAVDSDKDRLSGTDDEKEENQPPTFRGFLKKGKMMQQFVEDEAELSGSEEESDENVDLDEEDDYMEAEAGDADVVSEDQLRDEVGRVHLKQMLDDDDRELMRYKEMYLQDGDLHSEGGGRQRRFHWKDFGDEPSQPDLFPGGEDETEIAEDPDEMKWRMERHEREKFLESQQALVQTTLPHQTLLELPVRKKDLKGRAGFDEEEENDDGEEDSQFMKFGQCFMKRQASDPSGTSMKSKPKPVRSQSVIEKSSPGKFLKPKIPKRGSFLSRSKESLARIAEITKVSGLNVNGTRGSRNFVFSVTSAAEAEEMGSDEQLLAKAAKSAAVKKGPSHKPPAKKKCVEPSPKPQKRNSIFRLLDK